MKVPPRHWFNDLLSLLAISGEIVIACPDEQTAEDLVKEIKRHVDESAISYGTRLHEAFSWRKEMCEINPRHSMFFSLEVFTSNPNTTEEEFRHEAMGRVLNYEIAMNADGRLRFHVHEVADPRPKRKKPR